MRALFLILTSAAMAFVLTSCSAGDETAAVQKVVTDYHTAVAKGDAKGAMKDFADDAMMLESGIVETRKEYEDNHLPADIEFESTVKNTVKTKQLGVKGEAAWVISTMDLKGPYQGGELDIAALELMVLAKQDGAWKIKSIAWNSHRN